MIVLEGHGIYSKGGSEVNAWIQNCCIGGSGHFSSQKTVGMAELEDELIHRFGGEKGGRLIERQAPNN
jgi:hypothetical protein